MKIDKTNNLENNSSIIISASQLDELDTTHSVNVISNTIDESNNRENFVSRDSISKDSTSINEDSRYINYILV